MAQNNQKSEEVQNYDFRNIYSAVPDYNTVSKWPLSDVPRNRICYKLYYYLLGKSARDWNNQVSYGNPELKGHSYVSDRYWHKQEAAGALNCTPRTITNNLNTLVAKGVLHRDTIRKGYIFTNPDTAASIPFWAVSKILDLDKSLDSVRALQILSILVTACQHQIPAFTITDIKAALPGGEHVDSNFIKICIAGFTELKILEVETAIHHDLRYGTYTSYKVTDVSWDEFKTVDGPKLAQNLT